MLLSSTAVRLKDKDDGGQEPGAIVVEHLVAPRKEQECDSSLERKQHHYETNAKSLEDIL